MTSAMVSPSGSVSGRSPLPSTTASAAGGVAARARHRGADAQPVDETRFDPDEADDQALFAVADCIDGIE